MKVCIAEKPSVARDIAHVLGATTRRDGYIEGNGYQVTWTFGHLCTLKEPHEYNPNWKRWSLHDLPMLPPRFGIRAINDQGIKKQLRIIASLVTKADEVVNCGDAGQEGELIQRWVLQYAGCTVPIKRLWISSLTEEAIREGFKKLKHQDDYKALYEAGLSRAIGDWLLGMNATRLFTLKYGKNQQLLSLGRVQTPTLALIVNRQKEIESFVSTPFWELKTMYREVLFNAVEGRFEVFEKGQELLTLIQDKDFVIDSSEGKEGRELPPRLFDLTSLQVECNKRYGFSADQTLKLIQALYEKKVTTYPRVDTTYLSNDIYPKIPTILKGIAPYAELVAPLLQKPIKKTKAVFDDKKVTDHHAIIPTGVNPNNLFGEEKTVFDLVARRFIAAFYPDCKIFTTTVLGHVETVDFKTSGKQILDPGWRVVIPGALKSDGDDQVLPNFVQGESGPHEPVLQEKKTQAPKYYTEASLLRAMETAGKQIEDEDLREAMKENGIGRPSTRAAIIETLFRRKYIQKDKKRLLATITGVELIDTIKNELLKSVELTGDWEKKLRMIEAGKYDAQAFIIELKQMVVDLVLEVKNDHNYHQITVLTDEDLAKKKPAPEKKAKVELLCPVCKEGHMVKGNSAWGCSKFNNGCSFLIRFEQFGKKLTNKQVEALIVKKQTPLIKGFTLNGVKVNGKLKIENQTIELEPEKEEPLTCPICKQGTILKGKAAYGCSNFQACKLRIPFEIYGKKITMSMVQQMVEKGKTRKIKGFTINGESRDACITLNSNGLNLE